MAIKKIKVQTQPDSSAMFVLLVDADPKTQNGFRSFLIGSEFTPVTVNTVQEALNFLGKEWTNTALIIAEFNLDQGNAIDLRKHSQTQWRQVPFVICSQNFPANFVNLLDDKEPCPLLHKPYTKAEIQQLLHDVSTIRVEEIKLEREALGESIDKFTTMLEDMENLILHLEESPSDSDAISRVFGIIHTIKGSSSFLRSTILSDFCHKCEDALEGVKNLKVPVTKPVITVLLQSKDILWEVMNALSIGEDGKMDLTQLCSIFLDFKNTPVDLAPNPATRKSSGKQKSHKTRDWLKVPRSHIEHFLKLNGEMTITKNMIDKFIRLEISQNSRRSKNMEHLAKLFEQFFKYQQDMQNKMMNLKKVSLAETFLQVRRDVRNLSDSLNKPVDLNIDGEKIDVDDSLVEIISSSLVHIIRNSMDHGFETAEERKTAGKSGRGSLFIKAFEDDERIVIEIKDDGRGIDPEKLRKAIVEKGLYSETEAAKLDKKALVSMIFRSGVSTSKKVTAVSGRGIGLDMVFTSITQIQGRIDVDSDIGKGTKFLVSLPLPKSVVIFKSLVVSRQGGTYAIPQECISQVLSTTESELQNNMAVQQISGKTMLKLRTQTFPLFDLQNVLENKSNDLFDFNPQSTIVIIQGMHRPYGLVVDSVLGIEDTVVKTLDQIKDLSQVYMGATIFGDGQVGLILNPSGVTKTLMI